MMARCRPFQYIEAAREEDMVDGMYVPFIAIGILAAIWAVVLYGSTFFGPK